MENPHHGCARLGARMNFSDSWSCFQPPCKGRALPLSFLEWHAGSWNSMPGRLFTDRQGAVSSVLGVPVLKKETVGKKRIKTSRPQLPWKSFSAQQRRAPGYSGASVLERLRMGLAALEHGGVTPALLSEEEILSGSENKGLRARRVCGWRAGDSLYSRGDLWELGQTHKRAQILGKSQLFSPLPEILRKIQQACLSMC